MTVRHDLLTKAYFLKVWQLPGQAIKIQEQPHIQILKYTYKQINK